MKCLSGNLQEQVKKSFYRIIPGNKEKFPGNKIPGKHNYLNRMAMGRSRLVARLAAAKLTSTSVEFCFSSKNDFLKEKLMELLYTQYIQFG